MRYNPKPYRITVKRNRMNKWIDKRNIQKAIAFGWGDSFNAVAVKIHDHWSVSGVKEIWRGAKLVALQTLTNSFLPPVVSEGDVRTILATTNNKNIRLEPVEVVALGLGVCYLPGPFAPADFENFVKTLI